MIAGTCLIAVPTLWHYPQKKKKPAIEPESAIGSDDSSSQIAQADKQETERR